MAIEKKSVVGKLYLGEEVTRSSEPELTFIVSYSEDADTQEIDGVETNYYEGGRIIKSGFLSSGNKMEIYFPRKIKISSKSSEITIISDGGFFGEIKTLVNFDPENNEFYTGSRGMFSNTKEIVAKIEFEDGEDFVLSRENFAELITSLGYFVWQKLEEEKELKAANDNEPFKEDFRDRNAA